MRRTPTQLYRRLQRAINAWHLRWALLDNTRQTLNAMRAGQSCIALLLRRGEILDQLRTLQVAR